MAKADLHVHSKYSDVPSTWLLKAYDSPESFTETETVYQQAKARGMNFVTLTDHDDIRGSLELVANHPDDCFVSSEITSYFPEDNCKVHILVYGISEEQFNRIVALRHNLYIMRDYIQSQRIAYSVAHATYDQDTKLSFEHIEKLVLLFDVFEVINGAGDKQNNRLLHRYLLNLNRETLQRLQKKHQIEPISPDPWVKSYTGGSDDHCGILIGSAWTQTQASTIEDFLEHLKNKQSHACGSHGSIATYAFGVFKHVHDYRRHRDRKYSRTKMNDFLDVFFADERGNWSKRFKKSQSLRLLKRKNSKTHDALHALLSQVSADVGQDMEIKISKTYQHITQLHDEMFCAVVTALTKHLPRGDIFKSFNRLSTLFPMTLLAAPFVGSARHQVLKQCLKKRLTQENGQTYTEKALWFTDTIDDLNGVSVSLRQIAQHAKQFHYAAHLVTCVDPQTLASPLPVGTINFVPIKQIPVPGYEQQTISFPSLLTVMTRIIEEQPDQIIISTPGPLGLAALLCAKLMDLPTKSIFHTDFSKQLLLMTDEAPMAAMASQAVNAFYKMTDQIFVPSQAYIHKLAEAGLKESAMQVFPRCLDLDLYCPKQGNPDMLRRHQLYSDFTLLFAGRISKDKNLNQLVRTFQQLKEQQVHCNLVVAGDGPDLAAMQTALAEYPEVLFTGRLEPQELIDWYRTADLFVFPSHTDTFGMVVLEAQACGLPCLVTNTGGPKEIIQAERTGHIVSTDQVKQWADLIEKYRQLKLTDPAGYKALRQACADHVQQQNNWQTALDTVLGDACRQREQTNEHNSRPPYSMPPIAA